MANMLLKCFALGGSLGAFVFIWFRTVFLIEYARLVKLDWIFKRKEWETYFETNLESDPQYPRFLREIYPSWGTKLIGCPFCFITFMAVFTSPLIVWWAFGPVVFFGVMTVLVFEALYKLAYK